MGETRNLFVSHLHEDDAQVGGFKDLLGTHDVDVRDSSITADNPNQANSEGYIKSQILAPRIQWAGTVVVIVTEATKNSDYVQWEIEYANKLGKRIVGVWDHGARESDLPEALEKYADAVVGWNADAIIGAINGEDNWNTPDGTPRPAQSLTRFSCA